MAPMEPDIDWLLDYSVRISLRRRRCFSYVMIHIDSPLDVFTQCVLPTVRLSDVLFPEPEGVSILMNDSTADHALRAIERYARTADEAVTAHYAVAAFPADSTNPAEIRRVAQARLNRAVEGGPGTVVAGDAA